MATVTHKKVSAVPDGADTSVVRPSDWNDTHDVSLADGDIPASIARDSEVTTAINALSSVYQPLDADIPTVAASQAEMEAGSESALRSMSPLRVAQAIAALGGGGGGYPLDSYALNGSHGDHFTSSSLSGIWTRRNFTSGGETHQLGPAQTHMRIATTGRAAGDGYFQTAPAGDWTIAMKQIQRRYGSAYSISNLAPCVVDTAGTGIMIQFYNSPIACLAAALTTYTYGGSFTQTPTWIANDLPHALQLPTWTYLRKAGTNYFGAYSFDGEVWSPETPVKAWAGTVDRIGMIAPLGFAASADHVIDVDWFNKIA